MARGFKKINYKEYYDFSKGYNDTANDDLLDSRELTSCENMVVTERGALEVRNGTSVVDNAIGSKFIKVYEYVVRDTSIIVEILGTDIIFKPTSADLEIITFTNMIAENSKPCFLQQQDVLYILDGNEIYEFGQKNYFSNATVTSIKKDEIVQCTYDIEDANQNDGKFFKAVKDLTVTSLSEEDYTDTTRWEDVTYITGAICNVIRPLVKYDVAKPEKTKFSFFGSTTSSGTLVISLDGETYSFSISSNKSATEVAQLLSTNASSDLKNKYTIEVSGNSTTFVSKENKTSKDGYVASNSTGITVVAITEQQGMDDINIMDEVKKCTLFAYHSASSRYVASGNPDKPYAVYFSEPNQLNYFKNTYILSPTSGEGSPVCLLNMLNSLLVGYNTSWYEYSGIDPATDGTWKRIAIPFGCIAGESVQIIDLYNFMYLGHNGLNIVNSNILSQYGAIIQNNSGVRVISDGVIDKTLDSIQNYNLCTSVYHKNIYYLAFCDEKNGTRNNKVLTYDTEAKAFSLFSGLYINDFLYMINGDLLFACDNYLLKYDDEKYTDIDIQTGEEKKIEFSVKTGALKVSNLGSDTFYDKLFVKFKQNINNPDEHIYAVITVDDREYKEPLLSNIKSFIWGESNWGEQWGKRSVDLQGLFVRKKGTTIKIEFTNKYTTALDSKIILYGFSLSFKNFIQHQYISNNHFN